MCPENAISIDGKTKIKISRGLCTNCGECARVCPAKSIQVIGESRSVEDVIKTVSQDIAFYSRSGGGVTLSGGEPLLQPDFASELMQACKMQGLDTAIETSGFGKPEDLYRICKNANLIFYDIKHFEGATHKALTGVDNGVILENLARLSRDLAGIPLIVRTPVVPGYTDSEANIKAIANFLRQIKNLQTYELMPYHRFGESKWRQLGRRYLLNKIKPPGPEQMAHLNKIARNELETG